MSTYLPENEMLPKPAEAPPKGLLEFIPRPLQISQVCVTPSIWLIENLLSPAECDHLIALAKEKLMPSLTVDPETGEHIQIRERSSSLCFLTLNQDETVTAIESRIADIVRMPMVNGEAFQILRYQIGEEYQPHYDYFDPQLKGSHKALERGGQRVVTLVLYLTEVEAGGETYFPNVDLRVAPKQGSAVLFYNLYSNGELDPNSLHASLPVISGEKWVATKWIREREYR